MKTAAEWADVQPCDIGTRKDWLRWISAIQSDARAGMVPEGELAELRASKARNESMRDDLTHALTVQARLEAELAKAWEALRALQPPGGKAK